MEEDSELRYKKHEITMQEITSAIRKGSIGDMGYWEGEERQKKSMKIRTSSFINAKISALRHMSGMIRVQEKRSMLKIDGKKKTVNI